jgi:hypothetical protein
VVKHLLIGALTAIFIQRTQMLNFYPIHIPDPLVHPVFEFHHWRQIGRYRICGPYIRGGDSVKRQSPGLDDLQHFERVFAIRDPGYVLGAVIDHP